MSLKEIRDWGTFVVSAVVPLLMVVGGVWLKNQRLEIERGVAEKYVAQTVYDKDRTKEEEQQKQLWKSVAETNNKLDTLSIQAAATIQTLTDLKDEVRSLKK